MAQIKKSTVVEGNSFTYEDDFVLIALSQSWNEPICVLAGASGKAKSIHTSSNLFTPKDILEAYEEVLDPKHWGMSETEVASHIKDCREWLIRNGCPAEELE